MESNMLELYKKLGLNEQRNELSLLLIKIDHLLNNLLEQKKIPIQTQAKNYDLNTCNIEEREILLFIYEDLWNIKNKILTLLISGNKGE